MKIIGIISILAFISCSSLKKIGVEPIHYQYNKIYLLVQIDSISSNRSQIFFTTIESYTNVSFKAQVLNSNYEIEESEFYKKMLFKKFKKGYIEGKQKNHKIKKNKLYLLTVDVLNSTQDKLLIENLVNPNKVKFSKLSRLN